MSNLKKTISYFRRNGIVKTCHMVRQRLLENAAALEYEKQRLEEKADEEALIRQGERAFTDDISISILVPAFNTPPEFLRVLVNSVLASSFKKFELIIADAGDSDVVKAVLDEYSDDRLVYKKLDKNGGIAENTNAALSYAKNSIITLLDHDDYIEPDALYHIADAFEKGALIAYTDEDKVMGDGENAHYFKPNRKPDFNRDMLYTNNYICHMFAVRRDIALLTEGERSEYDGAQDYDFILRCIEKASELSHMEPEEFTAHISKVLYHWRVHESSTAENPESKLYAYEAGRHVIEDMYKRKGIKALVKNTEHLGFYFTEYETKPDDDTIENVSFRIPKELKGFDEAMRQRALSYFARPEVKAVVFRVLDRRKCVQEEPYKGMKYWDSGEMHRASLAQNVPCINGTAYCMHGKRDKGIIVYDPNMVLKQ